MLKRIIIRDEAMREVQKGLNDTLTQTFRMNHRESRSYAIGQILNIQSISDVDPSVLQNCGLLVARNNQSPEDVRLLQQALNLPAELAAEIPYLGKNEAIIGGRYLTRPVRIYVPLVPGNGYVNDRELAARQAADAAALETEIIRAPETDHDHESWAYLELLGETVTAPPPVPEVADTEIQSGFFADHHAFLRWVQQHPDVATTDHYRHFKWGAGRGNRIKDDLVKWGLVLCERKRLSATKVKGGRPAEVMTITPKGEKFLVQYENR